MPTASHVFEILEQAEVDTTSGIEVWPALDRLVPDGATITVVTPPNHLQTVIETIDFAQQLQPDYQLAIGERQVRVVGQPGERLVRYQVLVTDSGPEKTVISRVVTKAPVDQIEVYGVKQSWQPVIPEARQELMSQAGIAESDWFYVDYIVHKESSWRIQAENSSSGAYGLCQSLPAHKMASAGPDWRTNPVTQLRWCDAYAHQRYGSWQASYRAWLIKRWW